MDELMHEGVSIRDGAPGRGSGRYPWGSGDNPYQHGAGDFLDRIAKMENEGLKQGEIAKSLGLNTTTLRAWISIAKNERKAEKIAAAKRLAEQGLGATEIGRKMGESEGTIRGWLKTEDKTSTVAEEYAKVLKDRIDSTGGILDVGVGVERELGISQNRLKEAKTLLESQGYELYDMRIEQVTNPGKYTTLEVLCPPGTTYKQAYEARDSGKLYSIVDYAPDGNQGQFNLNKMLPPVSISSDRVMIRYKEDGGINKDGVIEIRPGVPDLSLGNSSYAQVRIAVDGTRYLKGMAMYAADKMPDGVDIIFNTNKSNTVPKMDVLKKIGENPDNPFGALIKKDGQSTYIDANGEEKLSAINKVREAGDWNDWADTLSAQFLSKQPLPLIKRQLNESVAERKQEYQDICDLTNPTVKRHYLMEFANQCDYDAVHLKAASLPRQKYQVILPIESLPDNEIYAPNYINGEKVALVRYPHGGTFEIPILTVNNKNVDGKKVLGETKDAVGINKHNADRLSGADFDGDTVLVIPTNDKIKIRSTKPLAALEGFDTKEAYGPDSSYTDSAGKTHYIRNGREYRTMTNTQNEMGKITNLITDMQIQGASTDEVARAVQHSMVVIDAEKHHLDYRSSEIDQGIAELRRSYQRHPQEDGSMKYGGASTLISRAKSEKRVPQRQGQPYIDKSTGELVYKESGRTYTDKSGKTQLYLEKSTQMAETKNAYTLSTGTVVEGVYADYANTMKYMANTARKEWLATPRATYSPAAKQLYSDAVVSINEKVDKALKGAPRERAAQVLAYNRSRAKYDAVEGGMDKKEYKKVKQQELTAAREDLGAKREKLTITDREWDAVQAGAVSDRLVEQFLRYADPDELRQRSSPKRELSSSKQDKIRAMYRGGYTQSQIANALGLSTSTVNKYLNE